MSLHVPIVTSELKSWAPHRSGRLSFWFIRLLAARKAHRGSTSSTYMCTAAPTYRPRCLIVNASSSGSILRCHFVRASGNRGQASADIHHRRSIHDCELCQSLSARRPPSFHLERFARAKHRSGRAVVHFRTDPRRRGFGGGAGDRCIPLGGSAAFAFVYADRKRPRQRQHPSRGRMLRGRPRAKRSPHRWRLSLRRNPSRRRLAPAPAAQAPQAPAPAVQPRAASIKPESRRNPAAKTNTNTKVAQASTNETTAPPTLTKPEEKATPPVLLAKPEEKTDAPIVPKVADDTRNAPKPAATNDQTPVAE